VLNYAQGPIFLLYVELKDKQHINVNAWGNDTPWKISFVIKGKDVYRLRRRVCTTFTATHAAKVDTGNGESVWTTYAGMCMGEWF